MIAFIRGNVHRIQEDSILLDTGAIGYKIYIGSGLLNSLEPEEDIMLWTHQHIKEDAHTLFGFAKEKELHLFEKLLTVSGVGPKLAITMLSAKSPREIVLAITQERSDILSEIPGIGAKTAKRMILELKEKLMGEVEGLEPLLSAGEYEPTAANYENDAVTETLMALESLGYTKKEVERTVLRLAEQHKDADAGSLVKMALRTIGR
ncbi:Holliday junction branch migration protein RuvA [Clostridia bacterium]|nr:Holliday junction branch migration protein RuvA [Clostridia bacterium]